MDLDRALQEALEALEKAPPRRIQASVQDVGRVLSVGDGIAHVQGLPTVMLHELVAFEDGTRGEVLDLDEESVGVAIYGATEGVQAGSTVRRTGETIQVPVGFGLLGRVVDPLGRPVDGERALGTTERQEIRQLAPGPLDRQPIREPLLTGIKTIDAATPIGRGQRMLLLGDRNTGKASTAMDAIISQGTEDVTCVYVSIGKKRSTVLNIVDQLDRHDALDHTAVVFAPADAPASVRYLSALTGCTMAEWFAWQGDHSLVVYDDLSRHAHAYRELSLLLRRSPGREAYPGDIFSVHASLVERSFKLDDRHGGGSATALPIIETQRGNISAFIPTNLISMTDGQLYFDAHLYAEGRRPAIDVGQSVSRVGEDAQPGPLREVAAPVRPELSQYEEVKGFTRFGAIIEESTKRQIDRGEQLVEIIQQEPREIADLPIQVALLWTHQEDLLEGWPAAAVPEFEAALEDHRHEVPGIAEDLRNADEITPALEERLRDWVGVSLEAAKPDELRDGDGAGESGRGEAGAVTHGNTEDRA
jgi:F-type H+-transporting ATPase subunit alpha